MERFITNITIHKTEKINSSHCLETRSHENWVSIADTESDMEKRAPHLSMTTFYPVVWKSIKIPQGQSNKLYFTLVRHNVLDLFVLAYRSNNPKVGMSCILDRILKYAKICTLWKLLAIQYLPVGDKAIWNLLLLSKSGFSNHSRIICFFFCQKSSFRLFLYNAERCINNTVLVTIHNATKDDKYNNQLSI